MFFLPSYYLFPSKSLIIHIPDNYPEGVVYHLMTLGIEKASFISSFISQIYTP